MYTDWQLVWHALCVDLGGRIRSNLLDPWFASSLSLIMIVNWHNEGVRVMKEAYFILWNRSLGRGEPSTPKKARTEIHVVTEFHTFLICNFRVFETLGENLAYDRLTTSSQRAGFRAQHPVHIGDVTENEWKASCAAVAFWAGFGRGILPHSSIIVILTHEKWWHTIFSSVAPLPLLKFSIKLHR